MCVACVDTRVLESKLEKFTDLIIQDCQMSVLNAKEELETQVFSLFYSADNWRDYHSD